MLAFVLIALTLLSACAWALTRANSRVADKGGDDAAAWEVLRAKRDEIEADATISEEARAALRAEWAVQADAVLAKRAAVEATSGRSPRWLIGAVLTAGVAIYVAIGRWDAGALEWHGVKGAAIGAHGDVPPRDNAKHPGDNLSLEERVAGLKAKLAANPKDVNGWVLLARSYGIQRQFADSAAALEKALELEPGHPDLLADLADTLAMTQGRTLKGRPTELIAQALKADPAHQKSLALAATAAMERGDNVAAKKYWLDLRATIPADSPDLAQIDDTLRQLGAAPAASAPREASTTTGSTVSGKVTLAPELAAKLKQKGLPANAALFILARVPRGMPMPVAVVKGAPGDLFKGAMEFRLDDSQAMSPQLKLSAQEKVEIEARISMSGTPSRGPDDVSAKLGPVKVGARDLVLVLQ